MDLIKLDISRQQFINRFAVCRFYHISQKDFFEHKLYNIDENILFARIAISKQVDLELLGLNSIEYEKITGNSDQLLIDLFPFQGLVKEHFLKVFYLLHPPQELEDLGIIFCDEEENENV